MLIKALEEGIHCKFLPQVPSPYITCCIGLASQRFNTSPNLRTIQQENDLSENADWKMKDDTESSLDYECTRPEMCVPQNCTYF
jgi:hypothetical protein